MTTPPSVWEGVLRRLQSELPSFALEAWILPLRVREDPRGLELLAPSPFHRDRVAARYLPAIERHARDERGEPLCISLGVRADALDASSARVRADAPDASSAPEPARLPPCAGGAAEPPRPVAAAAPREQASLPYTFESFVVGPSNALAREAAFALARGRRLGAGALYLAAPTGNGKTHLAKAMCAEAHRRGRVVYASAEAFTTELLRGIRGRDTASFKRRFREGCDLLVLEDVQFFSRKVATQIELFHTLEHLRAVGTPVVLTGDRLPSDIPDLDPRLASRMASGLVAEIETPDASLRRAILRDKASAGGVRLPEDCLERLVEAVRGSVRDLEGVLIQLVESAALLKRAIDRDLTETALRKLGRCEGERRPLDVAAVVAAVGSFFGLTPAQLAGRSRSRTTLLPRQLAMYFCQRYTAASLPEIGRALGRAHPAVRNAIEMVERAILERAPLRYQVEEIASRLEGLRAR
jgi:chromosomal replication initiator protein